MPIFARNARAIRILVPVLIVLAITGIWFIKNGAANGGADTAQGELALDATSLDLETLKAYGLPIVIDFGADYCQPCREFKPILEGVYADMQGKAIIQYVDTEKYYEIAAQFPIQVIPTQVLFNADGTPYVPGDDMALDFRRYNRKDTGEHALTVHEGSLTEDQLLEILKDMGATP
jgi:thioredoxin 1